MSFNFGTTSTPKTAANVFALPTNPTTTTSASGFQFAVGSGDNKTTKPSLFSTPSSPSFGALGTAQPKTTGSSGSLSFGASPAPTSLAPATSLVGIGSAATSTPQFGFGVSKAASTTSFVPILGSVSTTTAAVSSTGLSLGPTAGTPTSAATSAAPKLSFGLPSTNTNTTAAPVTTLGTSLSAVAPTSVTSSTSVIPATGSLTFAQLEDSINKWTIDLEEQGKLFINQAKQLNAWDSLLISNGEKILNLNSSIERVKQQQQQLDQELDFVLAQQKELEELITPLEKELLEIPVTDIDRNQMYQFSEIIDSQLKQMSDDLKEIIEHINESNKDEESSNPITQISRILNAHMNSLQWIDRNTAQISSHLEQITKIQDLNRRNFANNNSFNHSMNM